MPFCPIIGNSLPEDDKDPLKGFHLPECNSGCAIYDHIAEQCSIKSLLGVMIGIHSSMGTLSRLAEALADFEITFRLDR